jgi:hypothetical protein
MGNPQYSVWKKNVLPAPLRGLNKHPYHIKSGGKKQAENFDKTKESEIYLKAHPG